MNETLTQRAEEILLIRTLTPEAAAMILVAEELHKIHVALSAMSVILDEFKNPEAGVK